VSDIPALSPNPHLAVSCGANDLLALLASESVLPFNEYNPNKKVLVPLPLLLKMIYGPFLNWNDSTIFINWMLIVP
jgi:hypothetical protein